MSLRHTLGMVDIGKVINALLRLDHRPLNGNFQRIQPNLLCDRVQVVVRRLGILVPSIDQIPPWDLRRQYGEWASVHEKNLPPVRQLEVRHEIWARRHMPDVILVTRFWTGVILLT